MLFLFVSFSLHPLPPKRPQQRPPGLLAACCWKKRARTARGALANPLLLGEGPVPAARTPWEGVATRAGGASSLLERWRQPGARQDQSPPGTSSGRQGAWLHTSSTPRAACPATASLPASAPLFAKWKYGTTHKVGLEQRRKCL